MEMADSLEKEKKTVDIFPLGKGKRVLVYLCDLIINFALAFFLFNIAVFPSARSIIHVDEKTSEIASFGTKRDSVLYGNNLLFAVDEEKKASAYFNGSLTNTFTRYSSYFVNDASSDYDVFHNYYITIKNDASSYISVMKSNDKDLSFFDYSGSSPVLKDTYKKEFKPAFDSKDSLGDTAKSHYESFQNDFFLQCYYDMLGDIEKNDLTYGGVSYKTCQNHVNELSNVIDNTIAVSSYISEAMSILLLFLLVPLLGKNSKTVAMLFMKVERVNVYSLKLSRNRDVLLYFIYQVALNLALILFVPLPTVSINLVFGLGVLLPLSLISLGLAVISLFFVLFNSFNRSLSDILTGTILITSDSLDEIYRSKGYKV